MIDGPFLFDTSADSYLERRAGPTERAWLQAYLARFRVHVSVITLIERVRGYVLLLARPEPVRRPMVETALTAYLDGVQRHAIEVVPLTMPAAVIAGQLMALCASAPTSPVRSHRVVESRKDRLSRWRFDIMIAATALATGMPLVHNNPEDFEFLRGRIEKAPERFPGVGPLNLILVKRLAG